MESKQWREQATILDIRARLPQSRPLGSERACYLLHYCHFGFECCRRLAGLRSARTFLRSTYQCHDCGLDHDLYWNVRLRSLRVVASCCRLACRRRVLEFLANGQNTPRLTLARSQELKTAAILLVCLCQHVHLRVFPCVHLPMAEFGISTLSGGDEDHW
jgi:hypothetical protein